MHAPGASLAKLGAALMLVLLVTGVVTGTLFVDQRIKSTVGGWAEQKAVNLATRAVNMAINEVMAQRVRSVDLAYFHKDSRGGLIAVQYEWGEINRIVSDVTFKIQEGLKALKEDVLPVPLGQVTGVQFLAGWGPKIPVKIIPVGAVDSSPIAVFSEAGINQTLHRILIHVKTRVRIVLPLVSNDAYIETKVPVSETLVLGQVPQFYLNWNGDLEALKGKAGLGGVLNLSPVGQGVQAGR